jgi:hypothetical protein
MQQHKQLAPLSRTVIIMMKTPRQLHTTLCHMSHHPDNMSHAPRRKYMSSHLPTLGLVRVLVLASISTSTTIPASTTGTSTTEATA